MLKSQNAALMELNQQQSIELWKTKTRCVQLTSLLQQKSQLCEEYGVIGKNTTTLMKNKRASIKVAGKTNRSSQRKLGNRSPDHEQLETVSTPELRSEELILHRE